MASLFLTMLPFVLTYTVATWHSPSNRAKPQPATAVCSGAPRSISKPQFFD